MARIVINLTIPAGKNTNDSALRAFVRQRANPDPGNLTDEEWLVEWTRQRLNQEISAGSRKLHDDSLAKAPLDDPDIVEGPLRGLNIAK